MKTDKITPLDIENQFGTLKPIQKRQQIMRYQIYPIDGDFSLRRFSALQHKKDGQRRRT